MQTVIKIAKQVTLDDLPQWAQRRGAVNKGLTEMWKNKTVAFTYKTKDFEYPLEERKVKVSFVFDYNGCSYIHGQCMKHKEVRSYALREDKMHIGRGETCALREVVAVAV